MSRWKTSFENQKFTQQIETVLAQLETADISTFSPEQLTEYSRLLKVLKLLVARLSTLDPELYHPNTWANFPSWVGSIKGQVVSFVQNQDVGHLTNANAAADEILSVLRPNDLGSKPADFKALTDASDAFHKKIADDLQRIKTNSAKVKTEFDNLSNAIKKANERLDESDQVINQQKSRLDQSISDFQKQFSEAQEKRTNDFSQSLSRNSEELTKQIKTFGDKLEGSEAEWDKEHEALRDEVQKKSDTHLNFLKNREEEVNRIFGAIGSSAFAR